MERALLSAFLLTAFLAPTAAAGIDPDRPSAVGTDDGIRIEARLAIELLDQWLEHNTTIALNALPVSYVPSERVSAEIP